MTRTPYSELLVFNNPAHRALELDRIADDALVCLRLAAQLAHVPYNFLRSSAIEQLDPPVVKVGGKFYVPGWALREWRDAFHAVIYRVREPRIESAVATLVNQAPKGCGTWR